MSEKRNFHTLMNEVCVRLGYCGGLQNNKHMHVTDFIPESGEVSADQFVEWVFMAEHGDKPELASPKWFEHRKTIKRWFVEHMGAEVVDASLLRYDQQD